MNAWVDQSAESCPPSMWTPVPPCDFGMTSGSLYGRGAYGRGLYSRGSGPRRFVRMDARTMRDFGLGKSGAVQWLEAPPRS